MQLEENAHDVEAQAAQEILLLRAEIKEKQERVDKLLTYFKDADKFGPGKYERGSLEIVVSTNQRISETKAKRNLTTSEYDAVSTKKVDSKKARAFLNEDRLKSIMDHYDHKIEIRIKE